MISKQPTVAIYHDIRKTRSDGANPITIRVTYDRRQKYYTTPYSLSKEDYAKLWTPKPRKPYKEMSVELKALEKKADDIIKAMGEGFSFKAFEAKFMKARSKWNDAFTAIQDYINELNDEGRVTTAMSCTCCLNSLKKFTEREKLPLADIDVSFLNKYESWMLNNERSITTVGIYLRALRAVYNRAIKENLVSRDRYPFGSAKQKLYDIPKGHNIKKALTLQQIKQIFDYVPQDQAEAKARDLWIFIYLGNGLNVKDLALLKYKNMQGDYIKFKRAKTARTKKDAPEIEIPVLNPMPDIIKRWGNTRHPDNYIFPIMEPEAKPERVRELVQDATKTINKYTKRIGAALGLQMPITTYVARHSYATVLKRSGASTEYIREQLGHSSTATTENYLDSIESEVKKETQKVLTAF
jgi:integrase